MPLPHPSSIALIFAENKAHILHQGKKCLRLGPLPTESRRCSEACQGIVWKANQKAKEIKEPL